jgi:hypothetical protein
MVARRMFGALPGGRTRPARAIGIAWRGVPRGNRRALAVRDGVQFPWLRPIPGLCEAHHCMQGGVLVR